MFKIKKLTLNIFLLSSLFLHHGCCFSIEPENPDNRYFNSKLSKSLSTQFKYPRDDSRDHYYDRVHPKEDPELEDPWGDSYRWSNIADILARGIQTKEDYYKSVRLLNTEVDVLLDGSYPDRPDDSHIRNMIYIDNFGGVGGGRRRYGELWTEGNIKTRRTSNCWGQRVDFADHIKKRLVDFPPITNPEEDRTPFHNGCGSVCYRPKKGEAGNVVYSFKKGKNILEIEVGLGYDFVNNCDGPIEMVKLPDPTLRLEFIRIFKPCTIEISIADTADHIVSYPKILCVPDKLTYKIGLVTENTPFDFTQVKDISFIFKPVGTHEEEEAHFYLDHIGIDPDDSMSEAVPEPLPLVIIGFGLPKLIKKQKCKSTLYKNKFDSIPLTILVK